MYDESRMAEIWNREQLRIRAEQQRDAENLVAGLTIANAQMGLQLEAQAERIRQLEAELRTVRALLSWGAES